MTTTLRGVGMIHDSTQAWAVGDNGTIIQWNNSTWTQLMSPTTASLYTIELINSTLGWAGGGTNTNGALLILNGTSWSVWNRINFGGQVNATVGYNTDIINATVHSISINNATSAWAVGSNGTVLYWTGTEWLGQVLPSGANLNGVSMVHGNFTGTAQAWAVGDGGRILAWTGTTWIPEIPVMAIPLLLGVGLVVAFFGKSKLYKKPLH